MAAGVLIVEPNVRYVAETVVLLTSLGAKRSECNEGRRICDLFETKRAHRKILDLNKDATAGGASDDCVEEGVRRLLERDQVQKRDDDDSDLCLPQVFIDGIYVGDYYDLQGLEDDGILGRILRREICVKCYRPRNKESPTCDECGVSFEEVLPGKMLVEDTLAMEVEKGDGQFIDEDCNSGSDERFSAFAAIALKRKTVKPKVAPVAVKKRRSASQDQADRGRKEICRARSCRRLRFCEK